MWNRLTSTNKIFKKINKNVLQSILFEPNWFQRKRSFKKLMLESLRWIDWDWNSNASVLFWEMMWKCYCSRQHVRNAEGLGSCWLKRWQIWNNRPTEMNLEDEGSVGETRTCSLQWERLLNRWNINQESKLWFCSDAMDQPPGKGLEKVPAFFS